MRRLSSMATTILAIATLTGCQPASPTPTTGPTMSPVSPTAVPTPTYMCTPEAGGDEAPCSQIEYEDMKAKDALYAEAEAVYRTAFAENIRISRAGGVTEPTEVMLETMHGFYLDDALDLFQSLHARQLKAKGSDPLVVRVERLVGQSKAGSIVAIRVCVDSRGWSFYRSKKHISQGKVAEDDTYFARFDGVLKMIGADGRDLDACE